MEENEEHSSSKNKDVTFQRVHLHELVSSLVLDSVSCLPVVLRL